MNLRRWDFACFRCILDMKSKQNKIVFLYYHFAREETRNIFIHLLFDMLFLETECAMILYTAQCAVFWVLTLLIQLFVIYWVGYIALSLIFKLVLRTLNKFLQFKGCTYDKTVYHFVTGIDNMRGLAVVIRKKVGKIYPFHSLCPPCNCCRQKHPLE